MKRAVLLLAFLSCAARTGFSQGQVSFNNNGIVAGNPDWILVHNVDGSPLIGTNWLAQLYYGAQGSPESSLIPASSSPVSFRLPTTMLPGTWFSGGTRTLMGFVCVFVNLQVKVWDSALFPTYETAFSAGGITGKSIIFDYFACSTACCGGPPAWALMTNFRGFTLRDPSAPLLSVVLSRSGNQFVLSWPTNAIGFALQSSSSLSPNATWADFTNAPVTVGEEYFMTNTVSAAGQFYRLKK
ncbi:MAG TPA: hypothetical protein VFA77_12220 [Candidatus Eisenbacteria bacterium]|jgi:hypothetical protein|nr:hypothetical protein [Candidatus Eisenbacteria bacterium]